MKLRKNHGFCRATLLWIEGLLPIVVVVFAFIVDALGDCIAFVMCQAGAATSNKEVTITRVSEKIAFAFKIHNSLPINIALRMCPKLQN